MKPTRLLPLANRLCSVAWLVCLLLSGLWLPTAMAQVTLTNSGIKIVGQPSGTVEVYDSGGTLRMNLNGYRLTGTNPCTSTASVSTVTVSGKQAIQMDYTITGDSTGLVRVRGQYTPTPYNVHIHFDIWGSSTQSVDTAMLRRRVAPTTISKTIVYTGQWTRSTSGDVPYEMADVEGFNYAYSDTSGLLSTPGANYSWNDGYSTHLPAIAVTTGQWYADADFSLINSKISGNAAAIQSRPLALEVWTAQPYNLWMTSASTLTLSTQVINTTAATQTLTLSWWARNFAGQIVSQNSEAQSVASGAVWNKTLSFTAPTRDILFVEVSATNGTVTDFKRTNLAILPAYTFASGDESIFGLSAQFKLPTVAAEQALVKRMGVRHLRNVRYTVTDSATLGIYQDYASSTPDASLTWSSSDLTARNAWIDGELATADSNDCEMWEFDNEMNLGGAGLESGDGAASYVNDWLKVFKTRKTATGALVKIMNGGLAGWDNTYAQALYDAGAWNYLDALAIHPGRGNFTADYPGENGEVSSPNRWSFYGQVRKAKNFMASHGTLPLYLTETYACTAPLSTWHDTYRQAAESVLLSYALAMEEGVRVMHFYQLNDTTHSHVGEVDPSDSEYHYGLLNRDLSIKPSLLAYATIAEALDQATFVRWMLLPDSKSHGLLYNTPRGPMAIIWSRADGYIYNRTYPEAWMDGWPTKTTFSLPVTGTTISVSNCIGQATTVTASGGVASVTVDGAPRIIYGLPSTAGAYQKLFTNTAGADKAITYSGWLAYSGATAADITSTVGSACVRNAAGTGDGSSGYIYAPNGAGSIKAFIGSDINMALPEGTTISWDAVASLASQSVRLLIRLDNGQWYVSNASYTPPVASSFAGATYADYHETFSFTTAASAWSLYSLTPGSSMGVGAALTTSLPSRVVTGIGFYLYNPSSLYSSISRIDTLQVSK